MSTYKRGNKWWLRFRFNHKRYFRCSPENSQAGARAYEALLRHKLANGEPITECDEEKVPIPTFQEFSARWMNVYVKTNNKYSEFLNKKYSLSAHLLPYFGHKAINEITNSDVENFKAKKINAGLAPKSVNNYLIILSRCLKAAQEQDDWSNDLKLPRIKLLKVRPQKFDHLTKVESRLLLDNCEGMLRDMILVALRTGLRFGELTALEWSDIDFVSNKITVARTIFQGRVESTKSNKIRHIPMTDEVSHMLSIKTKTGGYVFAKNGNEPLNRTTCLRWLQRLCKKVQLRNIGWHTLRHTFASHLAQRGVSIMAIRDLLGHADIKTTLRYSHLNQSVLKDAISVLEWKSGDNVETIHVSANDRPITSALTLDCINAKKGL
jgi:integrase